MDDADRLEAKGLARAKIRAKRRRKQTIRRRTIRGSLALFGVLWAVVFAQLVSGNDPALSNIPPAGHKRVAATERRPAREPTPEPELELGEEAEPALEVEPVPEEEFAPEAEPEAVPEEEFVPEEEEFVPEAAPEPEPAPVVTASS